MNLAQRLASAGKISDPVKRARAIANIKARAESPLGQAIARDIAQQRLTAVAEKRLSNGPSLQKKD